MSTGDGGGGQGVVVEPPGGPDGSVVSEALARFVSAGQERARIEEQERVASEARGRRLGELEAERRDSHVRLRAMLGDLGVVDNPDVAPAPAVAPGAATPPSSAAPAPGAVPAWTPAAPASASRVVGSVVLLLAMSGVYLFARHAANQLPAPSPAQPSPASAAVSPPVVPPGVAPAKPAASVPGPGTAVVPGVTKKKYPRCDLVFPPDFDARIKAVNRRPGVQWLRARVVSESARRGAAAFPAQWQFQYKSPSKDQGSFGNCWCFAGVMVLQRQYAALGIPANASEQFVIDNNEDGYGCNGGDCPFDFLNTTGTATEAAAPYVGCGQGGDNAPVSYQLASWAFLGNDSSLPTVAQIKGALMANGPLWVGTSAGDAWQNYASAPWGSGSVITTGTLLGDVNHAVVIDGWDDTIPWNDGSGNVGVWFVQNSWSTAFGMNGYCYVGYGCGSTGTGAAYAAVQAPPAPTPTPVPTPTPTPVPTPVPTPSPTPTPTPPPTPTPTPNPNPVPVPGGPTMIEVTPSYEDGWGIIVMPAVSGPTVLTFPVQSSLPGPVSPIPVSPPAPPKPTPAPVVPSGQSTSSSAQDPTPTTIRIDAPHGSGSSVPGGTLLSRYRYYDRSTGTLRTVSRYSAPTP